MKDTAIVVFRNIDKQYSHDIEIPLDITADELFEALDKAFKLSGRGYEGRGINFLKCENPLGLLTGSRKLKEFGVREGSTIIFSK